MQQSRILCFDGTLNRPEQVKALVSLFKSILY